MADSKVSLYSPALTEALSHYEGGGRDDMLFGGAQNGPFKGVNVANMTVGQALDFAKPGGAYMNYVASRNGGVGATPMGYGQIVGSTLKNAVKALNIPMDTPFSRDTQGRIINYLANSRIAGKSLEDARAGLRQEWAGLKKASNAELDKIIGEFGNKAPESRAGGASPAQPQNGALGVSQKQGLANPPPSAGSKIASAAQGADNALTAWLKQQQESGSLNDPMGLYSGDNSIMQSPSANNIVINGKLGLGA